MTTKDASGVRTSTQGLVKTLLVFVASFLVFGLTASPEVNAYDEGLILTGAMRAAAGAVPHRDFYALYGPGQFYALAGLFDLFGQNVWFERLYDFAVKAGIVCFVYAFSARLMRTPYVYLVTALCVLWIAVALTPVYPIWPTLLLIFASIWFILPVFYRHYSPRKLAAAGLCAGMAVVFRYDMGLLSLAVLSAALIVCAWADRRSSGSRLTNLFLTMGPFWSASGAVLILLTAAYVKYGVVDDFVFQILVFPSTHYVETRRLPFPAPSRGLLLSPYFIVYMPPAVLLSFLSMMTFRYVSRTSISDKFDTPQIYLSSLITLLASGLYFKGVVRVGIPHMISSIIPSLIILGAVVDRLRSRRGWFARGAIAAPAIAALSLTLVPSRYALKIAYLNARTNIEDVGRAARSRITNHYATAGDQWCNPQTDVVRAPCFRMSPSRLQAIRYVLDHTTQDQQILVANGINDKAVENDNSLYFLAGRQPATKWSHFDPGLQNSEPIQTEMIEDLKRSKPPLVVLDTEWDNYNEPNSSAKHSGVRLLDDYLRQNYEEVARFDPYIILKR